MKNTTIREICIERKLLGANHPVYFVADIASNHDGDLGRAKDLIYLAAEAGADAAKFQHFSAKTIVSNYGFHQLGHQLSHQASWRKSVFDVYQDASLSLDWTQQLKETCTKAGITFLTSAYSKELVDALDSYISAYKIGSGDITWHEIIRHIAKKKKPVFLATGAATLDEVCQAVDILLDENNQIVLMQCNTNYSADPKDFKYINLRVLNTYHKIFPNMILGLSDHTPGSVTVLGAIALGASVIEKHFTDDTEREGPDHHFAMDPSTWREMIDRSRELELALGDGIKKIEENELETAVIQKRALRFTRNISKGHVLEHEDLFPLRPLPTDGLAPYMIKEVVGKRLLRNVVAEDYIRMEDIQ